MDGNKDEALKCLDIAKDSIESGDRSRAMKFLQKARRLDPSIDIDDLLSKLDASKPEDKSAGDTSDQAPSNPNTSQNRTRRRVSSIGPSPSSSSIGPSPSSSSSTSATYTEEQITVVREIRTKKDYYEILGLEKSCNAEDVRKAYRKLSLKVHPDKNPAPEAEDAFKKVSKAFQCLSNEENKKKYDLVGSDEPVYERQGGGGNGRGGFNGFYEADINADEIFRNFFFGGMHPATTANFSGFHFGPGVRVRTGGGDQGSNWPRILIQLLPVILILLLNFLPSSEPVYSLSRSYSYDYRYTTQKGVNFYVQSEKFEGQYPPNSPERVALEQRIENDYHSILVHNCRLEWQQLHWGYRRETPNCDALKRFEAMS